MNPARRLAARVRESRNTGFQVHPEPNQWIGPAWTDEFNLGAFTSQNGRGQEQSFGFEIQTCGLRAA